MAELWCTGKAAQGDKQVNCNRPGAGEGGKCKSEVCDIVWGQQGCPVILCKVVHCTRIPGWEARLRAYDPAFIPSPSYGSSSWRWFALAWRKTCLLAKQCQGGCVCLTRPLCLKGHYVWVNCMYQVLCLWLLGKQTFMRLLRKLGQEIMCLSGWLNKRQP